MLVDKIYSHSVVTLIISCLISIFYYLPIVRVQLMCNSVTTLHVLFALVQLLQFNSLRNPLLHIVRRRTCFNQTRSSVLSVHLFFCATRLPNCACFSISASNSPFSAASRTLASTSAISVSEASSIAFLPLANSKGLLP